MVAKGGGSRKSMHVRFSDDGGATPGVLVSKNIFGVLHDLVPQGEGDELPTTDPLGGGVYVSSQGGECQPEHPEENPQGKIQEAQAARPG